MRQGGRPVFARKVGAGWTGWVPMVANTGLEQLCVIAETAPAMKARLAELFEKEFTAADILPREKVLAERFSNRRNAEKIAGLLS